jgi:hypothetical protein
MTIDGALMIAICYFLSKYLAAPKAGITIKENNDPNIPGYLQLEGIAVAETFSCTSGCATTFSIWWWQLRRRWR